jgi:putative transposase
MLAKIGDVKIVYHRPLEGKPKTATVRRAATGEWFVTITCEWEPTALPPSGQEVGLRTFATLTQGEPIENPRRFRLEEHALAEAQRKHRVALDAHTERRADVTARVKQAQPDLDEAGVWQIVSQESAEWVAWRERQRRRKIVARTHELTRWKREDFARRHSRRLAKSIHDAAWSHFADLIAWKAACAARRFIAVNPARTSQDCSGGGARKTDRPYQCPACGLVIDRDLSAARNILALGRQCLAQAEKPLGLPHGSRHV